MMAATPIKLGSEADACRSVAQHALILAFCSQIVGISCSVRADDALNRRLGAKIGLNDRIFVNNLTVGVLNEECRIRYLSSVTQLMLPLSPRS
jgi:hypothetical protein